MLFQERVGKEIDLLSCAQYIKQGFIYDLKTVQHCTKCTEKSPVIKIFFNIVDYDMG